MSLSTPSSLANPFFDVAILGAGFSGTLTAIHLLRAQREGEATATPLRIALIDSSGSFGPGIAYGRGANEGLLNVGAANMGAFPDAPGDFLRWVEERKPELRDEYAAAGTPLASAFLPRRHYGDYLEELLRTARQAGPHTIETIMGRALDLVPMPDGTLSVFLNQGRFLYAAKVVLALGNFSPPPPVFGGGDHESYQADPRYLSQPWRPNTVERLRETGDVLILGSGLTCLDFLAALARKKTSGTIHVLSRRGLFPLPHPPASVPFRNAGPVEGGTLRQVVRAVRRKIKEGAFWRDVIDSLRPQSQALWQQFSLDDRRRFLRHLRPYWETVRHRAPADVIALKDRLRDEGRLVCHRGRLAFIEPAEEGLDVVFQKRGGGETVRLRVGYVANGTGLATDCLRTGDALVRSLLDRGLARPDGLHLGLDADAAGRLLPARGEPRHEIYALGSIRRGTLWETTAVRELREQAAAIAARVRGAEAPRASAALPFDI
ncbi:Uncharacterized NAD(P)/FAD-binding protein YdhS [Verrucomicrobium sp. GAS474]|uniref:FAD/NAD(P)-binding protein n=1 Tax=Verrucomicrobium sp. GAS474 TaxID=1882831 RepID=UPI00087B6797|nr:FAD/NAD(P)-binding protein [Verrucomicrobium sp. GAS474]SDT92624.1 Uncharacterized NAD(P)/FAD-binding protein YdhS [Verrucomicrobium sp. GAS474]